MPVMRMSLSWLGVDAGYSRRPFTSIPKDIEMEMKAWFKKAKDETGIKDIEFLNLL